MRTQPSQELIRHLETVDDTLSLCHPSENLSGLRRARRLDLTYFTNFYQTWVCAFYFCYLYVHIQSFLCKCISCYVYFCS
ncbi:unnamed protein product [Cylicocyclus nassatus]|uniref:Uncharacterized protein n=1 Tax=Cylicocyclus nassatus TaxID=53992 RepID=A0AA36H405_CYLNA|nr:unnamed protein product [Cylicocyclus nassatus]